MIVRSRSLISPRFQLTEQFCWQLPVILLVLVPMVTYLLLGLPYVRQWRTFVGATLLNALLAVGCQLVLDGLTQRVTARYPGLHETSKRLLLLVAVFMTVTPLFVGVTLWGYTHFHWFGYVPREGVILHVSLFSLVANLILIGVFESTYSLTKWRENMLENEQLKKANLQSQYESLKNQVNPHFLFNTLNSLSSLIADEPQRAETFVDEMAKVYRYLLQTNHRPNTVAGDMAGELILLETELSFIHSYFHLLKTRYGSGIRLVVAIDPASQQQLLPPLTLQMLVENAVKHNVIQAEKPLTIELRMTITGQLMVRNNLQRRNTRALSNQVGLANIRAKYRLLSQRYDTPADIVVNETDGRYFSVCLPLLNPTQL